MTNAPRSTVTPATAFFDGLASNWSQQHYGPHGGMEPRIARFADALRGMVPAPANILDYGCGSGNIAAALSAQGYRVDACDTSPNMIESARTLHAGSGVRFDVIETGSAGIDVGLPAGFGGYDAIVCSSVLEYLRDLPTSLCLLSGALKPGGWLLATVPNISHPLRRNEGRRRWMMRSAMFRNIIHATRWRERYELQWLSRNRYTSGQWEEFLHVAGFSPVLQDCQDHPLTLLIARRNA